MLSNNYEVIKSLSLKSIGELANFTPLFGPLAAWGAYCASNGDCLRESLVIQKSFAVSSPEGVLPAESSPWRETPRPVPATPPTACSPITWTFSPSK